MSELLHLSALVPGLAVLIARRWAYAVVALAFFVSAIGDSLAALLGGAWAGTYVWLPLQVGLALGYVTSGNRRLLVLGALVLVAGLSAYLSFPGPEYLVTLLGGVAIVGLARGRLQAPLVVYFGLGGVFYLAMIGRIGDGFTPVWWGYQASRLAAYALFCVACFRQRDPIRRQPHITE